eukprot:CAMPEP_0119554642 /NCGR_PEP_ID=MMETSP1352-20130426/7063_1 /TAXON_ID=265584 /ORGANISM="Stauroneis constricta, Strain CCMP1120" /LENGTH=831 /DNA_ID=CAMNT_0007601257 /DNA_START=287 /DNA_END=2782 /DNA_ORIENTATION=-
MDEPFDELSGPLRTNAPSQQPPNAADRMGSAPPPAAFQAPAPAAAAAAAAAPRSTGAPPSNAFSMDPLPSRWAQYDKEAQAPTAAAANQPALAEQHDELDLLATGARSYSDYKNSRAQRASTSAAGPASSSASAGYSFKRSESYDTTELIRKYGGYRPENNLAARPGASAAAAANPPSRSSNGDALPDRSIRDQAMRVLHLADEQLKTPMEVRRTESGGFRASPPVTNDTAYSVRRTTSGRIVQEQSGVGDAYAVTRTASGTIQAGQTSGGRRVPSALAGLSLTRQDSRSKRASGINGNPGRYTFSDPDFREDEDLSEEEDDIMRGPDFHNAAPRRDNRHAVSNSDAPLVDVLSLEQRSAGSRAAENIERTFSGDYNYSDSPSKSPPRPTNNWSSRYFSAGGMDYSKSQQDKFLDRLDREHANNGNGFPKISAKDIFASSASSVRSAVEHVSKKAHENQVFGAGGFNFRQSLGLNQTPDNNTNLRTVWKDTSDDDTSSVLPQKPPVHKTWQEAMLNKRRRRRIFCGVFLLVVIAAITIPVVLKTTKSDENRVSTATGSRGPSSEGIYIPPNNPNRPEEETVDMTTFYVTSDVPYDHAEEEKFAKDLDNLPSSADFIVHLGNIQQAEVTMCSRSRYTEVSAIMMDSPVPVFTVIGAEDYLNCPDPYDSFDRWMESFENFENNFNNGFEVFRLEGRSETFVMLHDGVLFVGLHLVNGQTDDDDEWEQRHRDQVGFYFGMLKAHKDKFRAIVLLGNGRPTPQQNAFWEPFFTSVEPVGKPIIYLHANDGHGQGVTQYVPFEEYPEILAVQVQDGGKNPPLKVGVAYGERPFLVG